MRTPSTHRRHRPREDGRGLRAQNGTALVEFTLVLPFLLVLALAVVEFAKAFNYFTDMTHLAATAARYAAVDNNPGPEPTLPEAIAARALNDELRDGVSVCVSYPDGTAVGDHAHVTVTFDFEWVDFLGADLPPFLPDMPLDGTTTITSTADMRLERVPDEVTAGCNGGV